MIFINMMNKVLTQCWRKLLQNGVWEHDVRQMHRDIDVLRIETKRPSLKLLQDSASGACL
jgi:hypothetical protein